MPCIMVCKALILLLLLSSHQSTMTSLSTSEKVLDRLPGDPVTYLSADDVECDNEHERLQYPIEFLNNQTPSGLPPHKLRLKIGAVVMLLRNLDLNRGLCNGHV